MQKPVIFKLWFPQEILWSFYSVEEWIYYFPGYPKASSQMSLDSVSWHKLTLHWQKHLESLLQNCMYVFAFVGSANK